jgi:hypothetical protein
MEWAFFFRFSFGVMLCRIYFIRWLKLWLRQQKSKRGAVDIFERWQGSVKVPGKKFFTIKNSIKRKKVFAGIHFNLDCARAEAIFD